MSKLSKLDFYCGAGLAILFRKNEHISPSFIESIDDVDGRKSSGIFYKFKTKSENEAIIYIKYSVKQISVKNLSQCWEFSLSSTEKEKITKQISKNIPFFILLICANDVNKDDINGQAALLTINDYNKISSRSNIKIGLWTDNPNDKVERKKVFVIKNNNGNGTTREYYFDVKRNQIEKVSLDKLIKEYYPNKYNKNNQLNKNNNSCEDKCKNIDKITVYISNNPKKCTYCKNVCKYDYISYLKADKKLKLQVASCNTCDKKYINFNYYKTFIKGNKETNIIFKYDDSIYLLDDNSLGCKQCNSELVSTYANINIYNNINSESSSIEEQANEEVFYCKKCRLFYANYAVKKHLLNKYGINKIRFVHYNNSYEN